MNTPMTEQDAIFADALEDAAYGRLDILQEKLASNPQLVLGRGDVITPGGQEIQGVTILECAIGAGDPEMAAMIQRYFSNVEHGEEALEIQLARYRPCLEEMKSQQATYNLKELITIIIESKPEEVTAALNKQFNTNIKLHKALDEFRKAVQPKAITKPQMHYNYQLLIDAFQLYADEWNHLYRASGDDWAKCNLVWRQVIGYLQRGLPAVDRFAFAKSLHELVEGNAQLVRDTKYQSGAGSFPDLSAAFSSNLSDLGFDYGIYAAGVREGTEIWQADGWRMRPLFRTYVEQKRQACGLMQPQQAHQSTWCVIL